MLTLPIKKKWFDMIASGEKKEEYASLWKYMEGETEHRFPLYNYPDPGFRITEKYSHLSVVDNKSIC